MVILKYAISCNIRKIVRQTCIRKAEYENIRKTLLRRSGDFQERSPGVGWGGGEWGQVRVC